MSLKGQKTKSSHIEWENFQLLLNKLELDKEVSFLLFFSIGTYCALRISDILVRTWSEFYDKESLIVTEKKTGKNREIPIHAHLKDLITRYYNGQCLEELIFKGNNSNGHLSIQHVNRKIKALLKKYGIKGQRFSSHLCRKTFGRHMWNQNGQSEYALFVLCEVFGHSNISVTKRYLNITEEEIKDVYLKL